MPTLGLDAKGFTTDAFATSDAGVTILEGSSWDEGGSKRWKGEETEGCRMEPPTGRDEIAEEIKDVDEEGRPEVACIEDEVVGNADADKIGTIGWGKYNWRWDVGFGRQEAGNCGVTGLEIESDPTSEAGLIGSKTAEEETRAWSRSSVPALNI